MSKKRENGDIYNRYERNVKKKTEKYCIVYNIDYVYISIIT